ncbi:EF hand [Cooperia oncophora]
MQYFSSDQLSCFREEMQAAKDRFSQLDKDRKGHITVNDLRRHFRDHNQKIDERVLHELLNEVDLNKNGEIEISEFFQLYSGLKGGQISANRLVLYLDEIHGTPGVNRSGGGV